MLHSFARALLIIALCCAVGAQWAALQSVAWTVMLVQNSKHASLSEAVARTFDGAHPCSLCQVVQKGKSQEKNSDAKVAAGKIDLMCATRPIVMVPPSTDLSFAVVQSYASSEAPAPLLPPPRFELV